MGVTYVDLNKVKGRYDILKALKTATDFEVSRVILILLKDSHRMLKILH